MEDHFTLDELLMCNKALEKKIKLQVKLAGMSQGIDMSDWDDDEIEDLGDEGLPAELIEAQRAWNKRKQDIIAEREPVAPDGLADLGFGYATT